MASARRSRKKSRASRVIQTQTEIGHEHSVGHLFKSGLYLAAILLLPGALIARLSLVARSSPKNGARPTWKVCS